MGRKVFISVLGTSWYNECTYVWKDGTERSKTNFIQLATLESIGAKGWTVNDAVYILVTQKSKEKNWHLDNDERMDDRTGNLRPYPGLDTGIKRMGLKCQVVAKDIADGKTVEEIWGIFNTVYELLEEDDTLYFDFTHGYRYLPMFVLVLSSYAKFMKKGVSIAHMSYGNFESQEEEKPIMDLMSLATLQSWTSSAVSFREMGRVKSLTEALSEVISSDKNVFCDEIQNSVKELIPCLNSFESQFEICSGDQIIKGKDAFEICSLIDKLRHIKSLPEPVLQILLSIQEEVKPFRRNSVDNMIHALEWCKRYGLVQQGYTLCQECIVTAVCRKWKSRYKNEVPKYRYRNFRQFISAVLGLSENNCEHEELWWGELGEHKLLVKSILADDGIKEIRKQYEWMTKKRNQVNHGGFVENIEPERILNEFGKTVDDCIKLIEKELVD